MLNDQKCSLEAKGVSYLNDFFFKKPYLNDYSSRFCAQCIEKKLIDVLKVVDYLIFSNQS